MCQYCWEKIAFSLNQGLLVNSLDIIQKGGEKEVNIEQRMCTKQNLLWNRGGFI